MSLHIGRPRIARLDIHRKPVRRLPKQLEVSKQLLPMEFDNNHREFFRLTPSLVARIVRADILKNKVSQHSCTQNVVLQAIGDTGGSRLVMRPGERVNALQINQANRA